ncbi:MAG: malate synthase A [Deltaproteobacteria bacterium]|nr:malate synthase A [Deltaproteobacteria bacterium]
MQLVPTDSNLTAVQPASKALKVVGPDLPGFAEILTPEALGFLSELIAEFAPRVDDLMARRRASQRRIDAGGRPGFLEETRSVRESDWSVAPLPEDLLERRVEITGPVDRKMVINALNSGANVFMADFEDSNAPSWDNTIQGQLNLRDAVAGEIRYVHPTSGKVYELKGDTATLMVRPRGWHLREAHIELDGQAVPASLVDFGLYFVHNVTTLLDSGTGPYFYLPKLESHLEARLWNDVFCFAQDALGIPRGTIKATVLIETLPAAFEMDEILYELREHSAGLNCGRWDYIFSVIKTFRGDASRVLPDRGQITMTQPFMRAYTRLCIKTCHRRGVHAMGGMAAQIPIKGDDEANEAALARVHADKLREAQDGHDGTWVAHPGLIPVARKAFDAHMQGPNQLDRQLDELVVTEADLLELPVGTVTEAGLRQNLNVGILYLEAWLGGLGCVPLYNLMEDAATAEISRTQVWQWLRYGARLDDGRVVDNALFTALLSDEVRRIRSDLGEDRFDGGHFEEAVELFRTLSTDDHLADFLTLPAYQLLVAGQQPLES